MIDGRDEEIRRLRLALRFARERIAEDSTTMRKLAELFPGDDSGKMAQAREIQNRVDTMTFAIIDGALSSSN